MFTAYSHPFFSLKIGVNLANPLVIVESKNFRWFSTGFSKLSLSSFWCFSQLLQSIRVRTAILRVPVETASPASGCAMDRKTARTERMNFNAVRHHLSTFFKLIRPAGHIVCSICHPNEYIHV